MDRCLFTRPSSMNFIIHHSKQSNTSYLQCSQLIIATRWLSLIPLIYMSGWLCLLVINISLKNGLIADRMTFCVSFCRWPLLTRVTSQKYMMFLNGQLLIFEIKLILNLIIVLLQSLMSCIVYWLNNVASKLQWLSSLF